MYDRKEAAVLLCRNGELCFQSQERGRIACSPVSYPHIDVDSEGQSFSTFFYSRHTEQRAKTVRAHCQFLRGDFIVKASIKVAFKYFITRLLTIVLFIKIILIMNFRRFISKMYVHICCNPKY
jgi:hypothetical protein